MTYPIYCEECLVTMNHDELDNRFDYEVCFDCVENLGLEPEWQDASDDFPMYLEYEEVY